MKSRILKLIIEFTIVFFGALLAFFVSRWIEEKHDERLDASLIANLVDDVRKDSASIIDAINALRDQHDSLSILLKDLEMMDHKKANQNVYCTYFSYDLFEPTSPTIESVAFGRDMKRLDDADKLRQIKNLDHINHRLRVLHDRYYESIESFRNSFICQFNVGRFDFGTISSDKGIEFWNRLKFLNYDVQYYHEGLLTAQKEYNDFLRQYSH